MLEEIAAEIGAAKCIIRPSPEAAWELASELATPEHLICVTGSFFLAAEIRRELKRRKHAASPT